MDIMKCIAVDDEPLALNIMEDFINKIPYLEFVGSCNSAFETIELLNRKKVDLIFLDINMPHLSGLELLKSLNNNAMVIFTTAYSEYALEGFNLDAVDYLLKPVDFNRFVKAVNKAYELFLLRNKPETLYHAKSDSNQEFIVVKADYKTRKIAVKDIIYIEGLKDYVKIYLEPKEHSVNQYQRPIITKSTLIKMEEKLPSDLFQRIHKSFILNLSKIEVIENNRIVIGEKRIPIGNNYKKDFFNRFENK